MKTSEARKISNYKKCLACQFGVTTGINYDVECFICDDPDTCDIKSKAIKNES